MHGLVKVVTKMALPNFRFLTGVIAEILLIDYRIELPAVVFDWWSSSSFWELS